MGDNIQYYLKNSANESDDMFLTILEETLYNDELDISLINKLSCNILINKVALLPCKYTENHKIIQVELFIEGQIEYITNNKNLKLYNFSIPKHILLETSVDNSINIATKKIYLYDAICKKLTRNSFYVSFLVNFNFFTI